MNYIKKLLFLFLCGLFFTIFSSGIMVIHAYADDKTIVIYTSADVQEKLEYTKKRLKEEFPQYEFIMEYMSTGNHAAKLKAEGLNTSADISMDLDVDYLEMNRNILADLPFNFSIFAEDIVLPTKKYSCAFRVGGSIVINPKLLKEKNLPVPTTYADLLKPEYKGLISMSNPKTSGTAYSFLKSLVNAWGEDEAFEYFDKLSENVLQFTASGAGPVNSLIQGEVVIGFGMTASVVNEINKGADLEIIKLDVGSPYALYGFAVIKGKEKRKIVMDVANFFHSKFFYEVSELYYPERLYKDKSYTLPNYPANIVYADMSNGGLEERQRLLDKWEY